jgi:DNA-binding CsgD family transcriptional regulator
MAGLERGATGGIDENVLIDRIYEAAALPELWTTLLDDLGAIVDCDKAAMFSASPSGREFMRWITNERARPIMERFVQSGWQARNVQTARMIALGEPRFINDLDIFTREELEREPYYVECVRPLGVAWGTGTAIGGPSDNKIIISINRAYEDGPVDFGRMAKLTALRPHIARSAFMSARLRLEQARGTVDALARVGLPAAALSGPGRIAAANPLFDALVPAIVVDGPSRMQFVDREGDRLFLAQIRQTSRPKLGKTFPVKASEAHPAFVVHVLPVAGASHDIFSGTEWLVILIPVQKAARVSLDLLEGLFDLTTAEAKVANGILSGRTLGEIAASSGLSKETTRTQLKAVFAKTATKRQSELVSLLSASATLANARDG